MTSIEAHRATRTRQLLAELIAIPTVSRDSNRALIDLVQARLLEHGASVTLYPNPEGSKASLFATVGPAGAAGLVLSAHSDTVPVEGQRWTSDPFRLVEKEGRLVGRGAADMKGFLAAAIGALIDAAARPLRVPLHLALSYDEEIGCVGVRPMLAALHEAGFAPRLVLVGEPTGMRLALGHKGKLAARARVTGVSAHSALAPKALNALHLAADFILALRAEQAALLSGGAQDEAYEVPTTTIHAGRMSGGLALNIVPDSAEVEFEIRAVPPESAEQVLQRIAGRAAALVAAEADRFPSAAITLETTNQYPGVDEPPGGVGAAMVGPHLPDPRPIKVAFGTEAGLFRQRLGCPVVICGPGSMEQGHTADEFMTCDQLALCDQVLGRLVAAECL